MICCYVVDKIGNEVIPLKKRLFILSALFVTGCSLSGNKVHQSEVKTTQNYERVLGIHEDQVTSMYVGYHVGPGGSWEFTTSDRAKIKSTLDFLIKQNFENIGAPADPPTAVDIPYDKLEFTTLSKHVDVDFVSKQDGQIIRINNILYRISSTPDEENNLFLQLKSTK